jgi:hypothetical protein
VVPRAEALASEIEAGLSGAEVRALKKLLAKLDAHARGMAERVGA